MNKTILHGKWRQARGVMKTEWGKLTENDRRWVEGKFDQMVGMLEERYGYTQERAAKTLAHYLGDYGNYERKRVTPPRTQWVPIAAGVSFFSLIAVGWVFFSHFLTEDPEIFPKEAENQDLLKEREEIT